MRGESLSRAESWAWLEPVVECVLAEGIDLGNKLVEVHGPGDFVIRDIPPP